MTRNLIVFLVYFFSILVCSRTRLLTPGHTNPNRTEAFRPKPSKRNELKPRQESNPKLAQRFPLHTALYPLSYGEVEASRNKLAVINRCSSHDSHVTLNSEHESYGHVTLATANKQTARNKNYRFYIIA